MPAAVISLIEPKQWSDMPSSSAAPTPLNPHIANTLCYTSAILQETCRLSLL
jgi:hypothetical protein